MALFSHKKKKKASRTVPLPSASPLKRWLENSLKNRGLLGRLLLCFLALAVILVGVQGWKLGFRYRPGDRANRAITAKVDFRVFNRFETERKKNQAAEQVPYVFNHDTKLLVNLPSRLRAHLGEILQSEQFDAVSAETRSAFGLTSTAKSAGEIGVPTEDLTRKFNSLKGAIKRATTNSGNQIDTLVSEFERMTSQLNQYGRVSPDVLARNSIPMDQLIRVVTPTNPTPSEDLLPSASDVLLPEMLKDTGSLGRSWTQYPGLAKIRPYLDRWLLSQVPFTLQYNNEATQKARTEARERIENNVYDYYEIGAVLVPAGELIDEESLSLLRAEYDSIRLSVSPVDYLFRSGIVFFMLLLLALLNGFYLVRNEPQLVKSAGRLSLYLGFLVLAVVLGRILWFDKWRAEVIPLLATVVVFAIVFNQKLATITALTLCLVLTLSTSGDLTQFVVLMSVSVIAVIPLNQVASRSALIKVGALCAVSYFLISWCTGVIQNASIDDVWLNTDLLVSSLRGAGWCLVVGYLVAGSLPFIEPAFGMVTDMSLLELGDVSHPLLQELVHRAPGTYNHSIAVATIGETAADRIGANGLLVRVGAYFHDIGKMLKPQYFVENMTEGSESRHEHLAPAMSTLIIIGHVKDGVDLARQHNLPESIISFIEQHHGTTLVEYFFHEAAKQADRQPDHKTDAEESSFRYPGPKPQSKEAGVMMLADAVESASRTLSDPTPKRIESLVQDISLKRLLDGQFDESSLTLSEIRVVEDSLIKSLIAIYHGRIKYPEQRTA